MKILGRVGIYVHICVCMLILFVPSLRYFVFKIIIKG